VIEDKEDKEINWYIAIPVAIALGLASLLFGMWLGTA